MSQAEDPRRLNARQTTVEDVRQLMGASTPHFALQLRNRIAKLIAELPADHPARVEGEREIARLQQLGVNGETRGEAATSGERPLPSLSVAPSTTSV
ncbi:MAG TPA: hypothetical protein VFY36_00710 [Solirubrobacteraceae bacterium]|nr:hypothetical protein [Solirubrobacteraceae bacterium]